MFPRPPRLKAKMMVLGLAYPQSQPSCPFWFTLAQGQQESSLVVYISLLSVWCSSEMAEALQVLQKKLAEGRITDPCLTYSI